MTMESVPDYLPSVQTGHDSIITRRLICTYTTGEDREREFNMSLCICNCAIPGPYRACENGLDTLIANGIFGMHPRDIMDNSTLFMDYARQRDVEYARQHDDACMADRA